MTANGEVVYDETRTAHLASRVAGTVWRVEKQVGDRVRKGDVLALIDAAEVGQAKAEFLQAIAQLRLKQTNVERLEAAGRKRQRARQAVPRSRGRAARSRRFACSAPSRRSSISACRCEPTTSPISTPTKSPRQIQFLGLPAEIVAHLDDDVDDLESVSAALAAGWRRRRPQGRSGRSRRHDARRSSAWPTCGRCG